MSSSFEDSQWLGRNIKCDAWELHEKTLSSDPSEQGVSETLFAVSNGLVSIRGYSEESRARTKAASSPPSVQKRSHRSDGRNHQHSHSHERQPENRGVYVASFYEQRLLPRPLSFSVGLSFRECFLCRAPDPFCIDVFIAGEHVCGDSGRIVSHTRQLDLRTGTMLRRMVWESASRGREVTIESLRFASVAQSNIAAVKYTVSARNVHNTDIRIVSRTQIGDPDGDEPPSYDVENVFTNSDIQAASSVVFVRTKLSCRHLAVATAESCVSATLPEYKSDSFDKSTVPHDVHAAAATGYPETPLSHQGGSFAAVALTPKSMRTPTGTETLFSSCISEQTTIELVKFAGFFGSEDGSQEDLCDLASQRVHECRLAGFDALLQAHKRAMESVWQESDVTYDGSPAIQGAIRFNTLKIMMNANLSAQYSFPTRGLGPAIGGQQQWDVDAIIVPYLAHVCPERARAMLQFRINTLPAARSVATEIDLPRGAVYPFRTIEGSRNLSGNGFTCFFVNSVIVYALKCYVNTTNDFSILNSQGVEMLLATATPLLDWGTWDKGSYNIRCVAGPDLYNGLSDNNFFTNLMARFHMQWAVQVANHYREKDPDGLNDILHRCAMTEQDLADMERAASRIAILFDAEHRIHPVDQTFMTKKKWRYTDEKGRDSSIGGVAPTSAKVSTASVDLLTTYHPNVIYRHQICRIPEVVLAAMLLPETFTNDEAKVDLLYYEAIASRDSALRLAIFSTIASRARLAEKADRYFRAAAFVDLGNIVRTTAQGLHCTTAAGCWHALITGFGKMRIEHGFLHFNPTLPEGCEGYSFHVRHKGCLVRVRATDRVVAYTLVKAPDGVTDIIIIHANVKRVRLSIGQTETVHLLHKVRALEFDCVVFDLDAVLSDIETAHYEAWKATLEQYFHEHDAKDFTMSRETYLAYLCHLAPFSGLSSIFKSLDRTPLPIGNAGDDESAATLSALVNRKLHLFREYLEKHGVQVREGAMRLLRSLRECGILLGCVSYSKNGRWMLDQVPQLHAIFDEFLDGNDGIDRQLRWRPETDFFEACARGLNTSLSRTIVFTSGVRFYSKSYLERFFLVADISEDEDEVVLKVPYLRARSTEEITLEVLERVGDSNNNVLGKRRAISPTNDDSVNFSAYVE